MVETVTFTMHMDKELHRRLKAYVALRGVTMKDFLNNVIADGIANDNDEYSKSFYKELDDNINDTKNRKIYNTTEELFVSMGITNYK